MNCYLSRNYKGTTNAGNKAKTDIERIMSEAGFKNVGLRQTQHTQPVTAFLATLAGVLKTPFCLHRGDVLVLQYPLKKYFAFVCRMAHLRGAKVISVIHDLGSFRRKKLTVPQEIRRLGHADYIIAHNAAMRRFLEENGCRTPVGELGIFDYLSAVPVPVREAPEADREKHYGVLYAGGLNYRKNRFLYDIGQHIRTYTFYLYGNGFEIAKAQGREHLKYLGFCPSDRLIETAQGDFGLVWDGASLDACTGDWGEYLKYNNPHKTSLYLRAGLPVIIWSQAAMAPFIRQNGAGLCVDSLRDIDAALQRLSPEEYRTMRENARRIGLQLAEGHYTQEALRAGIKALEDKNKNNA